MNVAFYSMRLQFDGDFLEKRGLGGSESALINMTRNWKIVFPRDKIAIYNGTTPRKTTNFNGVIYKTLTDFFLNYRSANWDAFITMRDPEPLMSPYLDAKVKCLWSQDDMNEPGLQVLQSNLYATTNADCIFGISNYACGEIKWAFPDVEVIVIRNGYNDDWLTTNSEKEPIAVYASTPFRGLDVLVEVWPRIFLGCKERGIEPRLKVFSSMSLYGQPEGGFGELYRTINQIEGAEYIGAVSQKQLYEEFTKAKVMLYPNHYLETGCMAVLEALANGVWVVTTDLGALGEQVVDRISGYLIEGDAHSDEYKDIFIERSIHSLCGNFKPKTKGLVFSWKEQAAKMRAEIQDQLDRKKAI